MATPLGHPIVVKELKIIGANLGCRAFKAMNGSHDGHSPGLDAGCDGYPQGSSNVAGWEIPVV